MLRRACDVETPFGNEVPRSVESRRKVKLANSATCHPIPERVSESIPANDAVPTEGRGLWLAHSSELELSLLQVARHERPNQELRERILKACGIR
jgi:hypothetical protein